VYTEWSVLIDVTDDVERTNGSWATICLHAVYMEELLDAHWTGQSVL